MMYIYVYWVYIGAYAATKVCKRVYTGCIKGYNMSSSTYLVLVHFLLVVGQGGVVQYEVPLVPVLETPHLFREPP